MAYLGDPKQDVRLVIGMGAEVPEFTSDDAGVRDARELYGAGSSAYGMVRERAVRAVVDAICVTHPAHWRIRARLFEFGNPDIGPEVIRRLRDAAALTVMGAVGRWLEDLAPWLFEEVI